MNASGSPPSLLAQADAWPTAGCAVPGLGWLGYREKPASQPGLPTLVLLHGIGSGSGSWLRLLASNVPHRLLAWDAPGYADSTPLPQSQPGAQDYARALWAWLDALQIQEPVHLVGHSLGCIMAAGAARQWPERLIRLSLLSPAQGYGSAPAAVREQKTSERLQAMQTLGMQAMAAQRAARLLSAQASADEVELAVAMMARLHPGGYAQATHLLGFADLRSDLQSAFAARAALQQSSRIACGALDAITPPAACQALAQTLGLPYTDLGAAGHLCALQADAAVLAWLQSEIKAAHA